MLLSCVWLFATPWNTERQASLSTTNGWSPPKPMSIESVMQSNYLILCRLLSSYLQTLPASVFFPVSQLFASGGQSIGISASMSVLPMNTQDWSLLGWTGWISLQSKGLSRVFSNTTVQKHEFFSAQLSYLATIAPSRLSSPSLERKNTFLCIFSFGVRVSQHQVILHDISWVSSNSLQIWPCLPSDPSSEGLSPTGLPLQFSGGHLHFWATGQPLGCPQLLLGLDHLRKQLTELRETIPYVY